MPIRFVYITAPDIEEAKEISRVLVEEQLAACTNILPSILSVYRWEGKIDESEECVIIAKTVVSRVPDLIKKIESIHSYKTPCAVSLTIDEGSAGYLKWIEIETKTGAASENPRAKPGKPSK